ncbi:MAG: hypothetical protein IIA83_03930 [Thaumarchaeota archaeon]|nr:hypothetical protein [Nitrososphaerota archaeon]
MPRWNYVSRNKRDVKPKRSTLEIRAERVCQFLDAIQQAKDISDSKLQIVLFSLPGWGPGVFERTARMIKYDYTNEVCWNKKERVWSYVPAVQVKEEVVRVTN